MFLAPKEGKAAERHGDSDATLPYGGMTRIRFKGCVSPALTRRTPNVFVQAYRFM
jgi:hypothetical protein